MIIGERRETTAPGDSKPGSSGQAISPSQDIGCIVPESGGYGPSCVILVTVRSHDDRIVVVLGDCKHDETHVGAVDLG